MKKYYFLLLIIIIAVPLIYIGVSIKASTDEALAKKTVEEFF